MSARSGRLNVLIISLVAPFVLFHVDAHISCSTVGKLPGICVPKKTCGLITELLRHSGDPPPDHIAVFIQRIQCGVVNDVIYVCCSRHQVSNEGYRAPKPMQLNGTNQSITTTTKSPQTDTRIQRVGVKSSADIATGMSILRSMNCGNPTANRVDKAHNVDIGEFPWMVLLVYDNGIENILSCSSSLITDQYVLTAAQCIRTYSDNRLVRVRLGEYDTRYDPDCVGGKCAPYVIEIDIEEALYHQYFSQAKFSNDIGLIRMIRKATIGPYVTPICLPITQLAQYAALPQMLMSGWTLVGTGRTDSILQKARVIIKDIFYYGNFYKNVNLTSTQLCAVRDDKFGSCKAEGPLFSATTYYTNTYRFVQYGVLVGCSLACGSGSPYVFTDVDSHLNWIAGNIRP